MRFVARIISIAAIIASSPSWAQQWVDYVNREYRFAVNFPVEPKEQDTVYRSADGTTLTAHVFFTEQDMSRYSVTVVSFPTDVSGAAEIAHAAALLRPRGKVVNDAPGNYDGVPAQDLTLIDPKGRQIMASILFYDRRLYSVEADVGSEAAPPIQFQQSITIVGADGQSLNLRGRRQPLDQRGKSGLDGAK